MTQNGQHHDIPAIIPENLLAVMRPLTHDERLQARQQAAHAIVGEKPKREHFDQHTISRFGPKVQRWTTVLIVILLLAVFAISALRIYSAGYAVNRSATAQELDAVVGGASAVVSAEIGMVIFVLAFAVLEISMIGRLVLGLGVVISAGIALAGNLTIANPTAADTAFSVFAWLDAIGPPLIVLGLAYVLERRLLDSLQVRHANEDAFQAELRAWNEKLQNPEQEASWPRFYWNALRDAIYKANARTRGASDRNALSTAAWNALVQREMHADAALAELQAEMHAQENAPRRMHKKRASEKVHDADASKDAESDAGIFMHAIEHVDNAWIATCPRCGRAFEKDTEKAARLAMTAHYKRCSEVIVSSNGHNSGN